ncbi:ATP-binding protein [Actinacidiphila alni]|uniref:ATP-binding protein n=1 Tax=Actinacidiphila alni TaxID=380248 RepID=UPI003451EC6E
MKGHIPHETSSFVGRSAELARLDLALAHHRLITLTGPGGVGKTRLAQRAAARASVGRVAVDAAHAVPEQSGRAGESRRTALDVGHGTPRRIGSAAAVGASAAGADQAIAADTGPDDAPDADADAGAEAAGSRFPDGTWWADLATLDGPHLLLATVSDAVDLADHSPRMPVEALCAWLADQRLLLVLDSCEHLTDACAPLVEELLAAAPGLTVLATSRRPLGLAAEESIDVEPLPPGGPDALALFDQRVAGRLGPGPLAAPGAREAAERICHRLEGIPLAIELAAAQVGPAPVADVADRLGPRFDVLSRAGFVWPHRHRTLRTAIGWSHELCTPQERLLWARLSVLRGAFDLAAAEAVAAGGPLPAADVAPTLDRLVAQSVVRVTAPATGHGTAEATGARYRMLDTIREYGDERLHELDEHAAVSRRHAEHFTGLARWADSHWSGHEQLRGYRLIEDSHPDLCAALDHWLAHDPARAAELAGLLVYFWTCCGHLKEARTYLEQALAAHTEPDAARTRALTGLGATVTLQGEYDLAARISDEVATAARERGDTDDRIAAACLTGLLGMLRGEPQKALDAVRAALGPAPGFAFASPDRLRCTLVEVLSLTALGHFDEGRARSLELREHCVRTGEVWTRSYLDYQLSLVALFSGAPAEAVGYARTMLESKRLIGDAFGVALGLDLLAAALAAEGRAEQAASVYGTGGAYWRSVGHPQRGAPELRLVRERCEETARAALGDQAYAAAYTRGSTAHGPTALAAALRQDPQPG